MIKHRTEQRNQKMLVRQNEFDKSNFGMLMIRLGALVHELATPVAEAVYTF